MFHISFFVCIMVGLFFCYRAVQFLQRANDTAAGFVHGFDTADSRFSGSHGGNVRDFFSDGRFAQIAVICSAVCRFGRIDDQVDLAVGDQVGSVGSASFADLIHKFRNNMGICQCFLGAFGGVDLETCFVKTFCDLSQFCLIFITDGNQHRATHGQLCLGRFRCLEEGFSVESLTP